MDLVWTDSMDKVDWNALSELMRLAPLGDKSPDIDCAYICDVAILPTHQGKGIGRQMMTRLIALSRGHKKIILYAVPGKEGFYARFGFRAMTTAMAIFEDQAMAVERGYLRAD